MAVPVTACSLATRPLNVCWSIYSIHVSETYASILVKKRFTRVLWQIPPKHQVSFYWYLPKPDTVKRKNQEENVRDDVPRP